MLPAVFGNQVKFRVHLHLLDGPRQCVHNKSMRGLASVFRCGRNTLLQRIVNPDGGSGHKFSKAMPRL